MPDLPVPHPPNRRRAPGASTGRSPFRANIASELEVHRVAGERVGVGDKVIELPGLFCTSLNEAFDLEEGAGGCRGRASAPSRS